MTDVHDLGGASGFEAITGIEGDFEYEERWEWTLMAVLRLGVKKGWYPTDAYRHAIERLPRAFYLGNAYYDRMLSGVTQAHIEAGIVTEAELKQHLEEDVAIPAVSVMGPGHAGADLTQSAPFPPGTRVRVRSTLPEGHVRAPDYVRGHLGTIVDRGRHALAFPGQAGHRMDASLEFTYRVEFDRRTLWSDATDEGTVIADLSESYLERVDEKAPQA